MIKTKTRKISVNARNNHRLILPPFWWGVVFEDSPTGYLEPIDGGFILSAKEGGQAVAVTKNGKNKQVCLPKSDSLNVETTLDTDLKEIKIIYV